MKDNTVQKFDRTIATVSGILETIKPPFAWVSGYSEAQSKGSALDKIRVARNMLNELVRDIENNIYTEKK